MPRNPYLRAVGYSDYVKSISQPLKIIKITHVFLELGIPTSQLKINITGKILKTRCRQCCQLLARLISFWVKFFSDGKK
jgi:hypothetical protein